MRTKPTHLIWTLGLLLLFSMVPAQNTHAAPSPGVTDDQPTLNFPDSITFHADIESSA